MTALPLSARRFLAILLALLFGLTIAILSVIPINRVAIGTRPRHVATAQAIHQAALLHVSVHIIIFAVAAAVAWFAAITAESGPAGKLLALVLTLLLGYGTEYLEHVVYHQPIELNDVFTNVVAISLTFALLALIARYRNRRRASRIDNTAFVLRDLD